MIKDVLYQDVSTGNMYIEDRTPIKEGDLVCYLDDYTYIFTKYNNTIAKSECIKLRLTIQELLVSMIPR